MQGFHLVYLNDMADVNANEKYSLTKNGQQLTFDSDGGRSTSPIMFREMTSRRRVKTLFIISIILFILLLAMVILYVVTLTKSKNENTEISDKVCNTRQCVQTSARIMSYLNTEVDPCEDFYEYSCGGWIDQHTIPKEKPNWDIFEVLIDNNNKLIKNIFTTYMDNKALRNEDQTVNKLITLYESCVNTDSLDSLKPLIDLINTQIGGSSITNDTWDSKTWTYFDKLSVIEDLIKRSPGFNTKVVPFLDTKAIADPYDSEAHIIEIGPPKLGLVEAIYYTSNESDLIRSVYRNVSIDIVHLMGVDKADAVKIMDDVFNLEKEISLKLPTSTELRDTKNIKKRMTIRELTEATENKFDWLAYVNSLMQTIGRKYTMDDIVIVSALNYMKQIVDVIKNTDKRVMADYFAWTVIQTYIDASPLSIQKVYFQYTKASLGILEEKARWETCITVCMSYMGMALGSVVVQKSFKEEMKQEVSYLVSQVKGAFRESLDENTWMDKATKIQAKKKLDNMLDNIAYPAFILNKEQLAKVYEGLDIKSNTLFDNMYQIVKLQRKQNLELVNQPVDRETWLLPPIYVNAFYDTNRNKMVFFAGILKPPFYSWNGPKSINFGGIGMVMGHEMIHGFDDQGRLFDYKGELTNWWSNQSASDFKKKSKCFEDQYASYTRFGQNANGILTLGENIADNGGLKTSFLAYQNWLKNEGPDIKLPALNLTNEQLFFVASSQIWCSKDRMHTFLSRLQYDQHSPGIFRVKGMLSNSEEFSKAFNCKKNSGMNPEKKCTLY